MDRNRVPARAIAKRFAARGRGARYWYRQLRVAKKRRPLLYISIVGRATRPVRIEAHRKQTELVPRRAHRIGQNREAHRSDRRLSLKFPSLARIVLIPKVRCHGAARFRSDKMEK